MATNVVFNDFRNGQVDGQFENRPDLSIYNSSAQKLENVVPFRSGGLTLREGTNIIKEGIDAERVIEFCVSASEYYFITLNPNGTDTDIYIYAKNAMGAWGTSEGAHFKGPWKTSTQVREIQYAQDFEKVVFVQQDFPPQILTRSGRNTFSFGQIVLDDKVHDKDHYEQAKDEDGNPVFDNGRPVWKLDGEGKPITFLFDYDGLFTTKDFPTVVTFAGNRLIFANSNEHPYRIWISRPFEHLNFQDVEYYQYVDEKVTTEDYLKAIENYTSRVEDLGFVDGVHQEKRVTKKVSVDGYVVIQTEIWDITSDDPRDHHQIGETTTETYQYTSPVVEWKEIVTDGCAVIRDIASERNERIAWVGYVGDSIFLGSATSEWKMSANIVPSSMQISKVASYGSMDYGSACNGAENIFYVQTGGKKIRSIYPSNNGMIFLDLTYQCESILDSPVKDSEGNVILNGVKELHWQRTPEPRLYAVLVDGTMAVLTYDPQYGMNAWTKWTTSGKFKSLCVVDTEEGQEVIVLVERMNEQNQPVQSVETFRKGIYTDHGGDRAYTASILTNSIATVQTLALSTKIYSIGLMGGGTSFVAGQEGTVLKAPRNCKNRLVEIPSWTVSTNQGLRIEVKSIPGEPFIAHALVVTAEVND